MMLFLKQPMDCTRKMSLSDSREIFEGKSFKAWKKSRDHDLKMQSVIIDRIDGVAKQIANQTKVITRRG